MKTNISLLLISVCEGQSYANSTLQTLKGDVDLPEDESESFFDDLSSYLNQSTQENNEEKESLNKTINDLAEQNKEIAEMMDGLKELDEEYEKKNKELESQNQKYKEKINAIPGFMYKMNGIYNAFCDQTGALEVEKR